MNVGAANSESRVGVCNFSELRKATRRVSQLYDAALAPCGLRTTQRTIMVQIMKAGSPTMNDLASALVLDRSALNHNLKPLIRDGLVTVKVDKNDRRSRIVGLTRFGAARLEESTKLWKVAQGRFEDAFGDKKAAMLRKLLSTISSPGFVDRFNV